jgi:16S rRNA processing protein RimM
LTSKAGDARAVIGRIAGTFGLRGEVKVDTTDPSDFRPGLSVRVTRSGSSEARQEPGGDDGRDMVIAAVRPHQRRLLVRFEGIDDATSAQALHGADLSALKSDLPGLPPNTYRDEDLIGMCVTDARLGGLGAVTSIAHYPHADMLVVGDRSLLIPLLAVYGVEIDVAAGSISTSLPDGFEDL